MSRKMRKQKSWNQGGRKRKQNLSGGEEKLSYLLDQAEEEELMKISAIHSDVTMPLPNRERLAWSVIDKADLADEEELKRREEFRRGLRRKKMIHFALGCGIVVIVLLVLAGLGVFDYFRPPVYEDYYVLGGNCCSEEAIDPMENCYSEGAIDPMEVFQEKTLPDGVEVSIPSLASDSYLDLDRLDTTAYDVLAEYCAANDYAVHEYKLFDYESDGKELLDLREKNNLEYRLIDDKLYVRCTVIGTCLDYGMTDDGRPWGELAENGEWGWEHPEISFEFVGSERSDIGEVIPILTSPLSLDDPANVCYVCLTMYVCIQDKAVIQGKEVSNRGDLVMGGEDPAMKKEYDAEDIPATTLDNRYLDRLSDLMEGEECQSLLVDGVKSLAEDLDDTWKGAKKFYVNKRAVYRWSAEDNAIAYSCPEFYVFSEDLTKNIGVLELYVDMEEQDYRLADVRENVDDALDELLKNHGNKKFFCIHVGRFEALLDENNEVIHGDEAAGQLKGDYAGALDKIGLAVTMEQLTDPDNLVEITLP